MTPTEQRIAIAEACGWTHLRIAAFRLWGTAPGLDKPNWKAGCKGDTASVPDYLNDLNAMAKAELTLLHPSKWEQYVNYLRAVCETMDVVVLIRATPAQRAEACLRAVGKWKD